MDGRSTGRTAPQLNSAPTSSEKVYCCNDSRFDMPGQLFTGTLDILFYQSETKVGLVACNGGAVDLLLGLACRLSQDKEFHCFQFSTSRLQVE